MSPLVLRYRACASGSDVTFLRQLYVRSQSVIIHLYVNIVSDVGVMQANMLSRLISTHHA